MTSERKHAANQANARHSTGPKTPAGKARVAQNAIKHGLRGQFHLIEGEDPAEYERFCQALQDQLDPQGALEEELAERVISGFWRLRRVERMEVEMFDTMYHDYQKLKRSPVSKEFEALARGFDALSESPESKAAEITLGGALRNQLQKSDVIGKFHRYEAHIERGLYKALHELQRLQTMRQGGTVPAPVAVDITAHLDQDR